MESGVRPCRRDLPKRLIDPAARDCVWRFSGLHLPQPAFHLPSTRPVPHRIGDALPSWTLPLHASEPSEQNKGRSLLIVRAGEPSPTLRHGTADTTHTGFLDPLVSTEPRLVIELRHLFAAQFPKHALQTCEPSGG